MTNRSGKPNAESGSATETRSTTAKRNAADQGGSPAKKSKPGDDTDTSTISGSSTVDLVETSTSSPGKPTAGSSAANDSSMSSPGKPISGPVDRAVVDFAVTGVQLPIGVTVLSGVKSYGYSVTTGLKEKVPVVTMRNHCSGSLSKIKRIINTYILSPSYVRFHNIYTADPKGFQLNGVGRNEVKSWRIGEQGPESKTASFYVIGRVVHSALSVEGEAKTVSLQVVERFWPRIAAFLAIVLNMDTLPVPIKENGLCFSTYNPGVTDWPSTSRRPKRGDHGADVRSWKVPVPTYDGRENFRLREYWDLNSLRGGEITQYSTAMVIFTVTKFTSKAGMRVGFNVQSVIAMADRESSDWTRSPDPQWHESLMDEKALGVDRVIAYDPEDEPAEVAEEEDDDGEGGYI